MKLSRAEPVTAEAFYLSDEDDGTKGMLMRMSGPSGCLAWLTASHDGFFPVDDSLIEELEVGRANVIKEETK